MQKIIVAAFFVALVVLDVRAMNPSIDQKAIQYDGQPVEEVVQLKADKYHTEYETVEYESTCTETVQERTGSVCHRHSSGDQTCEDTYRDVEQTYSCTQSDTIAHQIFDNKVEAIVTVSVDGIDLQTAKENIQVTLDGDVVSLKSRGSKTLVMELTAFEQSVSMVKGVEKLKVEVTVTPYSLEKVQAAFKINAMSVQKKILSYDVATDGFLVQQNVKVLKRSFIGFSSTVMFDGVPSDSLVQRNGTKRSVALDALKKPLRSGRYDVVLTTAFNPEAILINQAELPALTDTQKTLISIK